MATETLVQSALPSVSQVHQRLRRGDFGESLLDVVRRCANVWRDLSDEALRLKATYVAAEVFDYFGEYAAAAHLLASTGPQLLDEIQSLRAGDLDDVAKRRIWVVLAYATVLYRAGDYDDARAAFERCFGAVNALDPDEKKLFGTRARIAYSLGQVHRQLNQYERARANFEAAIVFAQRRFTAKTPAAELPHAEVQQMSSRDRANFEQDQLLALGMTGRSLALGVAWIAYIQGELSTARAMLNAGYTLLRGTGDTLHRAYVVLLMGVVERARVGIAGSDGWRNAVELIENGASGLSSHPLFSLRASYELALAHYGSKASRVRAIAEINTLRQGLRNGDSVHALRGSRVKARWLSAALVIESRMHRLDGQLKPAKDAALRALDQAQRAEHREMLAEALIAAGEVYLENSLNPDGLGQKSRYATRAIDWFGQAFGIAHANPKIAAVASLHLARAYLVVGELSEAHLAYARWIDDFQHRVEHGFVIRLAESVKHSLERANTFVVAGRPANAGKRKALHDELDAFFLRQAKRLFPASPQEQMKFVAIKRRPSMHRLERRLRKKNLDVGTTPALGRPKRRR